MANSRIVGPTFQALPKTRPVFHEVASTTRTLDSASMRKTDVAAVLSSAAGLVEAAVRNGSLVHHPRPLTTDELGPKIADVVTANLGGPVVEQILNVLKTFDRRLSKEEARRAALAKAPPVPQPTQQPVHVSVQPTKDSIMRNPGLAPNRHFNLRRPQGDTRRNAESLR